MIDKNNILFIIYIVIAVNVMIDVIYDTDSDIDDAVAHHLV